MKKTERERCKLYGLLTGSVHNRAPTVVTAISSGDGFEALSPNTQSRGLAMLSAATLLKFTMLYKPLQPQLLRLEDTVEEARKTGTMLQDRLKGSDSPSMCWWTTQNALELVTCSYIFVGTEHNRSGPTWFKLMMSMQFLWRLIAKRAKGITKARREKAKVTAPGQVL